MFNDIFCTRSSRQNIKKFDRCLREYYKTYYNNRHFYYCYYYNNILLKNKDLHFVKTLCKKRQSDKKFLEQMFILMLWK